MATTFLLRYFTIRAFLGHSYVDIRCIFCAILDSFDLVPFLARTRNTFV